MRAVFLIIALTFATQSFSQKQKEKIITETRDVSGFTEVLVEGNIDLNIEQGDQIRLSIKAKESIVPKVITRVEKNRLILELESGTKKSGRITADLIVTDLSGIGSVGSGDIKGSGTFNSDELRIESRGSGSIGIAIDCKKASINITGSGSVNVMGKCEKLTSELLGSGSLRAYDLKCNEINIEVKGSGSADLQADTKLKAVSYGSGSIKYRGNAEADIKKLGSGTIEKAY